jgi:hypothetical protein
MAFTAKMLEAARRNLEAADQLDTGRRRDVAGYLYGIAAECAIKEMFRVVAVQPEHDKDAILYAHFPKLRTLLRDALGGRGSKPLWRFILNDAFLHNWDVKMRYADARQIPNDWVDDWKKQAKDVVGAMET